LVQFHAPEKGWVPHEYYVSNKSNRPDSLVRFKESEKWFFDGNAAKRFRKVPYIDRNGLIHASVICSWKCSSYQLYMTIAATVYKRLKNLLYKVRHKYRPKPNLLARIAMVYALENNDSWYKRCISMLFAKRRDALYAHVYYYLKHVDANKRFLFDQVLQNTLWLQSRVLHAAPRERSTPDDRREPPRRYTPPKMAPCREQVRNLTKFLNLQWSLRYSW
jgi:hypothetical protein